MSYFWRTTLRPYNDGMHLYLGERYGRLVVIEERHYKSTQVKVRCDCGTVKMVSAGNLPKTSSCGCLRAEQTSARSRKHGTGYEDYRYRAWRAIKTKCLSPTSQDFRYYGGRGITMHEPWIDDFPAFAAYLDAELGPRPEGWTLDRRDNNGNYEPGNLRWLSRLMQSQNRRERRLRRIPPAAAAALDSFEGGWQPGDGTHWMYFPERNEWNGWMRGQNGVWVYSEKEFADLYPEAAVHVT